ncbi:inositol monophosphatase family protein [Magnetospirillum molischianum]|uniref:Archaeal fructose-1,6-bisphosphatase and related enzyme of inositol monophosphatase family n=1 Tax=Magnetospirillum molischianum DSM 120 TaxID=1150626 RepID=H8FXP6_MAGML|nr:inositol monophosphatase family protein [Magnetospirillum molischianum]CCG43134.1 Archaeal fructose-1,6-bisphosphatase and related enzyme of inositol monophosphatase family [Magnetospirillum molischianum DSM 120]
MTSLIDVERVSTIIRDVAAAEILPRFRNLTAGQIREKQPGQLVTEADIEAERVLTLRLADVLPGAACVGEEAVAANPTFLSALERSGAVWVIDPVDGTSNFAQGLTRFAVILALVVDGVTRIGWIFDPVSGRMTIAERGSGAWESGRRLSVLPGGPLETLVGSVKRSARLAGRVARVGRKGSAAHDYLDLVTGKLHFAHFRRLMPWDHAAGMLIHAEAGGYGRLIDGSAYRPRFHDGALLLAPDEDSWSSLRTLLVD